MKKYWIKDLTEKQVIHAPTEEIARKLCDKFHEMGLQWFSGRPYSGRSRWDEYREETCYGPFIRGFSSLNYYAQEGYEILTIDQLLDFQANEYPKVMEVSDDGNYWGKRVVFMEKNGKFLSWAGAETIEESEDVNHVHTWEFAREIQPSTTLELTIDQIAEKFNVSPEQIKIKEWNKHIGSMTPKIIPIKRVRLDGAADIIFHVQQWNDHGGWRGLVKDGVLQIRNVIEVIDGTMTETEFLTMPDWEG